MNSLKKLPKFIHQCMTIGEIPTSYKVSLTYEEQLMWFCRFLEEQVIPVVNNNSEVVQELKTFVETYFDNLDVQEEINNKLEEMVESGELQEIIAQYLQTTAVITFDTVADMISSENLVSGSVARTLGRSTFNDLKGATYKIVTLISHVADGVNTISLGRDDLYAQLIYENQIKTIDTMQDLKQATNISIYDKYKTLGYNTINDNGAGTYYIVDSLESGESANNGSIVQLQNGLYAKLIIDDIINVKQFGAVGDNSTDDTNALQNAINFSVANNYKKIFIPIGNYKITSKLTTPQAFNQPIISGENTMQTKISFWGESAIKFKGGSGQLINSYLENITFIGTGTNIAIELEGVCGYNIKNCHFSICETGILMHNNTTNEFTEFCQIINCRFNDTCHTALEYKRTNGTDSFHGSGILNSNIVQKNNETKYKIIIGSGCLVYNAPLDFTCWKQNTAKALITNNSGSPNKATFYGKILLEIATGSDQLICENGNIYLAGDIIILGGYMAFDNVILCNIADIRPDKAIKILKKHSTKTINLNQATTNIAYVGGASAKIVHVRLTASMYEYQYTLLCTGTASREDITITQLANGENFNQAGYGGCTFGHNGRNLTITNSNFESHQVRCDIDETPLTMEQ